MSGGVPVSVSFNPTNVEAGESTRLTVQLLSQTLGTDPVVVDVAFNEKPNVAGEQLMGAVPISISLPNGQSAGSWKLRTTTGTSGGIVMVSAPSGPGTNAATLTISP